MPHVIKGNELDNRRMFLTSPHSLINGEPGGGFPSHFAILSGSDSLEFP